MTAAKRGQRRGSARRGAGDPITTDATTPAPGGDTHDTRGVLAPHVRPAGLCTNIAKTTTIAGILSGALLVLGIAHLFSPPLPASEAGGDTPWPAVDPIALRLQGEVGRVSAARQVGVSRIHACACKPSLSLSMYMCAPFSPLAAPLLRCAGVESNPAVP